MLSAAVATGHFQIVAVADLDQQRAEKTATEHGCQAYSDYRRLIVQNRLDCLLVGAETHTCDEQIRAAIRRKTHILKAPPPARTFAELFEYVQLARSESVQFAIANPGRFKTGHALARDWISQGRLGHIFLVAVYCSLRTGNRPAWLIDPQVAGGGVLLHDCYRVLDQALSSFPPPEQVYALKTNHAPDKQQRLCLTEDTAVVCLRFNDAFMGSLVATRSKGTGPNRTSIEVHGKEGLLTVSDDEVVLATRDGPDDQRWPCTEDEQVLMERLLASFAQSLRTPDEHEFPCSGAESLRNMAVLEAAYVSTRTGSPEEPARILQVAGPPTPAITSV